MDGVSVIVGVISGVAGLMALSMQTVTFLSKLCDTYRNLNSQLLVLVFTLRAFENAWTNIHAWIVVCRQTPHKFSPRLLDQLMPYIPMSEEVLSHLRADMDLIFPDWRSPKPLISLGRGRGSKLSFQLMRNQASIKTHCERIGSLNGALTLLLSTFDLPRLRLQDIVLEVNQRKFRKDEETAWTLIETHPSAKVSWKSSTISVLASAVSRPISVLGPSKTTDKAKAGPGPATVEQAQHAMKRFSFEDDLLTGPVYKRVIFAALVLGTAPAESPQMPEGGMDQKTSPMQDDSICDGASLDEQISDMHSVLTRSSNFSLSCKRDLEELRGGRKEPSLRHLPMASILAREEMEENTHVAVCDAYLTAARAGNADGLADALDSGADLESRLILEPFTNKGGMNTLQLCIRQIRHSATSRGAETLNLLLLYHETQMLILRTDVGELLHAAFEIGSITLLNRLPLSAETLRMKNNDGSSPFHTAVHAGERSIPCLKKLIAVNQDFQPNSIRDKNGRTPLQLAILDNKTTMALYLLQLGGTTFTLKGVASVSSSELAQTIIEACNKAAFRTLLKVNNPLGRLLDIAMRNDRIEAARELHEFGAKVTSGPNAGVVVEYWIMARIMRDMETADGATSMSPAWGFHVINGNTRDHERVLRPRITEESLSRQPSANAAPSSPPGATSEGKEKPASRALLFISHNDQPARHLGRG